jgi:glutaredoxin 1
MTVEIFGAEWCTFCKQAVTLCESKNMQYDYIDIDETSNLKILEEKIGNKVKSIPQIFINGKLIPDGYSGLKQELEKD